MRSVSTFSLLPISIVSIAVLIAPGYVTAQSRSSCGCDDIPYLIDQLNKLNAALDAFQRFAQTANPNTSSNEIAPDPNPTRATFGTILRDALRQSMDFVQNTQSRPGTRACVAEIENQQANTLLSEVSAPGTAMNILDYIYQGRGAYRLMAGEILRRLNSMDRSCRPTEWFGSITAVETVQSSMTISVPAQGRFNKGSETTTSENFTRTGTIWLNGDLADPLSTWQVAGTATNHYVGRMMVACKGGLKPGQPDQQITNGLHREIKSTGSGSLSTTVGVSESDDARRSSVSLTLPGITVTKSGQTRNVSSGGCPGSDINRTDPYSGITSTVSPLTVKVGGSIFPGNPIKASGSETVDLLPAGYSIPGGTATHTVRVSYNLYRFR
jgi:hypothetical protein